MPLFNSKHPEFWQHYVTAQKKRIPQHLNATTFVVLDTETTGFNRFKDRILSIGAVKLQNKSILVKESFELYIKQEHYNPETAEIHGILKNSKQDQVEELVALQQFLQYLGNSIIVAHHAQFDINMINAALHRNGLDSIKNKVLDTSVLYYKSLPSFKRKKSKKQFTLDELTDVFFIDKKDRHTALGDALITAIAFLQILERLKPKNTKELFHNRWFF